MYSKLQFKNKARDLRKNGNIIPDIAKLLNLSKSTISLWCRDIILNDDQKNNIKNNFLERTKDSRQKHANNLKKEKEERINIEYKIAENILGKISDREKVIAGACLYWAEGSKKETGSGFSFINSDPNMILFVFKWLKLLKIDASDIVCNVAINYSHKSRIDEVLKFWSNLLDYPISKFNQTVFINTPYKRVYNNEKEYYGMLRLKVRKSAWLRRRIMGMIKVISHMSA